MSNTPNMGLTELQNGQANYVNANETFAVLDAILQSRAIDKTQTSAPGTHSDGDVRIMASAWTGVKRFDGSDCAAMDIAVWRDSIGVWKAIRPKTGWKIELASENNMQRFDGTNWVTWIPGGNAGLAMVSRSANYTFVLADANTASLHPATDTTGRTWTIPANSAVPYADGTGLVFSNQNGAGPITIAINSDTLRLLGTTSTGSRTLAANGQATAFKVSATEWQISGVGLT